MCRFAERPKEIYLYVHTICLFITAKRVSDSAPEKASEILDLLGYSYVQEILVATSEDAKSAKELSEALGADLSTIYRHADNMIEQNLLVEGTRVVDDGSHYTVYEANIDHVGIDLSDGELTVEVSVRESPADRFTRMWSDIRKQ